MDTLFSLNTDFVFWVALAAVSAPISISMLLRTMKGEGAALGGALMFVFGPMMSLSFAIGSIVLVSSQLTTDGKTAFVFLVIMAYFYTMYRHKKKREKEAQLTKEHFGTKNNLLDLCDQGKYNELYTYLHSLKHSANLDTYFYNDLYLSVVHAISKKNVKEAERFVRLSIENEQTDLAISDLITYSFHDNMDKALSLFSSMKYTQSKKHQANKIINHYLKQDDLKKALDFVERLFSKNIYPDPSYRNIVQYIIHADPDKIDIDKELDNILLKLDEIKRNEITLNILYDYTEMGPDLYLKFFNTISNYKGYYSGPLLHFARHALEFYTKDDKNSAFKNKFFEIIDEKKISVEDDFWMLYFNHIIERKATGYEEKSIKLIDNSYLIMMRSKIDALKSYKKVDSDLYIKILEAFLKKVNASDHFLAKQIKNMAKHAIAFYKEVQVEEKINKILNDKFGEEEPKGSGEPQPFGV